MPYNKFATLISISFFLLPLCGCNHNANLKSTLKDFTESTINIPQDLEFYYYQYSKPINNSRLKPYIYVIYLSPEECIGCSINNLPKYEILFNECKEKNISFIPIISPVKDEIELIKYYIDESECPFPVYIDKNGSFTSSNKSIPNDKRFHCFLLGPQRNPIFVGDPLRSEKLKGLFISAINE